MNKKKICACIAAISLIVRQADAFLWFCKPEPIIEYKTDYKLTITIASSLAGIVVSAMMVWYLLKIKPIMDNRQQEIDDAVEAAKNTLITQHDTEKEEWHRQMRQLTQDLHDEIENLNETNQLQLGKVIRERNELRQTLEKKQDEIKRFTSKISKLNVKARETAETEARRVQQITNMEKQLAQKTQTMDELSVKLREAGETGARKVQQIANMEKQLAQKDTEVNRLQNELDTVQRKRDMQMTEVQKDKQQLIDTYEQQKTELANLRTELTAMKQEIASLKVENRKLCELEAEFPEEAETKIPLKSLVRDKYITQGRHNLFRDVNASFKDGGFAIIYVESKKQWAIRILPKNEEDRTRNIILASHMKDMLTAMTCGCKKMGTGNSVPPWDFYLIWEPKLFEKNYPGIRNSLHTFDFDERTRLIRELNSLLATWRLTIEVDKYQRLYLVRLPPAPVIPQKRAIIRDTIKL
ncbi:MAG: hypothetical protein LBL71_00365 [Endomicrobium sp.]|jgi:hypothetical protein|nr:hypothetical protein [Endomicrobium sp.]